MSTPMAGWPTNNPITDLLMAKYRHECPPANRVPDHVLRTLANTSLTYAYRGAAADAGDPLASPDEAEWLRRLFDLDEAERLEAARLIQERCSIGQHCFEQDHDRRLKVLGNRVLDTQAFMDHIEEVMLTENNTIDADDLRRVYHEWRSAQ